MKLRGTLLQGESVRVATRLHWRCLLIPAFYALLNIFFVSFASAIAGVSTIWSFLGYLLAGASLYQTIKSLKRYFLTQYFITTHRLVIQRGLSAKRSISINFESITGCEVQRTWLGYTKIGKLTVYVQHGTQKGLCVLQNVPRAQAFSEELKRAQYDFNASYHGVLGSYR